MHSKDEPIDLLASVFRSAVARRNPDALLTVNSAVDSVVEIDARELTVIARVGDDGPRPKSGVASKCSARSSPACWPDPRGVRARAARRCSSTRSGSPIRR